MATEKQIAANRLNGLKGGVKTPEGKAVSCMNARKHGIFAAALTEHDAEGLRELLDELVEKIKPVGIVERLLVDKLAVTYLRMQRCARAETLHYRCRWNSSLVQPGQFAYDETVVTIGLYDARLTNQFLRLLHEIEARQRARTAQGRDPQMAQISSQEARSDRPASSEGRFLANDDFGAKEPALKTEYEPNPANSPAAGENPLPAKVKNEPISAADAPEENLARAGTTLRNGDSSAGGEEVKNEPKSAGAAQPEMDAVLSIEHGSCKIPAEPLNSCVRSS